MVMTARFGSAVAQVAIGPMHDRDARMAEKKLHTFRSCEFPLPEP